MHKHTAIHYNGANKNIRMAKIQKKQKIEKSNRGISTLATKYRLKAETGLLPYYGSSIYQTGRYMILFLYRNNRDDFFNLREQEISRDWNIYRLYKTLLNSEFFFPLSFF